MTHLILSLDRLLISLKILNVQFYSLIHYNFTRKKGGLRVLEGMMVSDLPSKFLKILVKMSGTKINPFGTRKKKHSLL
jgi:hypothetical protein